MARQKTKICLSCQRVFRGRADARTCSERCRKRLQRAKASVESEVEHIEHSAKEAVEGLEAHLTSHATEEGFAAGIGLPITAPSVNPPLTPPASPATTYAPPASESLENNQPAPLVPAPSTQTTLLTQTPPRAAQPEVAHAPGAVLAPATSGPSVIQPTTSAAQPSLTAVPLAPGPLTPPIGPSVEVPKQPRFQRHLFRLPASAKFAISGAFVVSVVAIVMYLLGNQFAHNQAGSNTNVNAPAATASSELSNSGGSTLQINRTTIIAGGNSLTVTGPLTAEQSITANGPVTIKNQTNSTSAFSVQDANASGVLTVDTTNRIVGIDTTPTAGGSSLQVGGSVNISGQYLVNGQPLGSSSLADFSNITRMGNTFNGPNELVELNSSGILPALDGSLVTNVDAITLQGNGANYYTNASNISSGTLADGRLSSNVALLNANNTFTGNNILNGNNTFSGQNTFNGVTVQNGNFLFQSATNATNAFQIQNAAGNDNLLVADTINTRVGIGVQPNYTLDVNGDINVSAGSTFRINGASICNASGCTPSSSSGSFIQNSTALQTNANFNFQSANVNGVGGIIRGASGQIADLFEGQTSTGSQVFTLDPSGNVNITGQYEINGAPICTVGGCTVASGSGSYIQNGIALQATANFNIESAGTGNVVGILKGISGQTADILQAKDGNGVVVFTVGSQGQILHKDTSSGSHTFFQIQDSSSQSLLTADTITGQVLFPNADLSSTALLLGGDANLYRSTNSTLKTDGNLIAAGNLTVNGTGLFRNTTDSTTAFQIQNATGTSNLLVADTSHTAIGVAMVPLANVASLQVTGGIDLATTNTVNSNTNSLVGIYNDVTNNGAGNAGMQGFYADLNNNSTGTLVWARDYEAKIRNNSTGTITDAYDFYARSPSNTGGGTIVSAYGIYLQGSNTTGVTNAYGVYQAGTSDTNFFNAKTNTFKSGSNTTTAFQIQNSAGSSIFNVDTVGSILTQSPVSPTYVGGTDSVNAGNGVNGPSDITAVGRYAYVARTGNAGTCSSTDRTGCELQIYDITDPTNPVYMGGADSVTAGNGTDAMNGIAVIGHYAYVGKVANAGTCSSTDRTGCELQIYDVANPTNPVYVAGADSVNAGNGSKTINGIFAAGRYIYTAADVNAGTCSSTDRTGCELQIYDVANPTNPVYKGGADIAGNGARLFVAGNYAYITNATGNSGTCSSSVSTGCELLIYDISNPTNPVYKGGADSVNAGNGTNVFIGVKVSGRYAYITKAGNSGTCSSADRTGCELQIYDISDPTNPIFKGGADTVNAGNGTDTGRYAVVAGKYLFFTKTGNAGTCSGTDRTGCELQVYDITDPTNPVYKGGADTVNAGNGADSMQNFAISGHYALVGKSGNAGTCSAADRTGCELQIYDISGIDVVSASVGTLETGSISVQNSASIANNLTLGGNLGVGQSVGIQGDLGVSGNAEFQDKTNSTTAFQIQNSTGTSILTADTTKGVLTQSGFGGSYVGGADASGLTNSGTGNSTFNATFTSGKYLYAVKNGDATDCSTAGNHIGCELQVYDVTNPTTPTYISGADASGSTNSGTGNNSFLNVYVTGHYAYIGKASNTTACSQTAGLAIGCELQVYDVSNPAVPTYVGGADGSGSANSGIGGTSFSGGIYASDRYVYISKAGNATACSQTAGLAIGCELQVYDVSNPAVPTYVGGADISGSSSGTGSDNSSGIFVSGRYAYFSAGGNATACSQTVGSAIGCELQVYDVSNPATPTYVGGADSSGSTNSGTSVDRSFAPYVSGRYVYVPKTGNATACSQTVGSAIGCELQVYDISNPATPTYVGGADASGSTNSGTGNNTFDSVYTYGRYTYVANSGNATACSQTAGSAIGCELQVYDVSTPAAPTYVGGSDASGSTNSGTGNSSFNLVNVSGRYAYVANSGSATACSQTVGSAIGCELQVYDVSGIDAVSISTGTLETGDLSVLNSARFSNDVSLQGSLSVGQSAVIQGNLTVAGSIKLQDKTNSTTAFQIQNSSGTSILTADTVNQLVTVANLQSTGTITLQNGQGAGIQLRTVSNSSPGNAMTFSGNEITDASRSVAKQGDGRQPPDSSMGIWEPATNLVTNGGFETNATGWTSDGGSVTTAKDTSTSYFGAASLKITTPATANDGANYNPGSGLSGSQTYTYSVWMKGNATVYLYFSDGVAATQGSNITLTNTWTRYTLTKTVAASPTGLRLEILTGTASAATFWADGVQLEQKAIATPYVETNGGTVTRNAASISVPTSVISSSAGWIAARVRMGDASSVQVTGTSQVVASWDDGTTNNRLQVFWDSANKVWKIRTVSGGTAGSDPTISDTFNPGDLRTIIVKWDASNTYVSLNGSTFVSASNSLRPTSPTELLIGASGLGQQFDGDILWTATGTGTLSSADALSLYNYGNSDPTLASLNTIDPAATPSFVWDGESTQYSGTNNAFTNDSQISIDDVNLTHTSNGSITIQGGINSTTAFQVQNAAGTTIFNIDTSGGIAAVTGTATVSTSLGVGVTPSSGRLLMVQSSNATEYAGYIENTSTNGSAEGLFVRVDQNGSGNNILTLQSGASNIKFQVVANGTVNVGSTGSNSTTSSIHIADTTDGTAVQAVTIGSSANASNSVTLEAGTGTTALFNGATNHTIQLATGAAVQAVTVGSLNTTSSTTIQGGTGASAILLTQGSGGTITIGITTGASGVIIQAGTGRITLTGQIKVAQSGTALSGTNLAESGGGTATLGAGSTDTAGSFTTSTTSHTTITLTFGATMTNAPFCVVTSGNAAAAAIAGSSTSYFVTTTATTLVVNTAADTTAAQWIYHCFTR